MRKRRRYLLNMPGNRIAHMPIEIRMLATSPPFAMRS
jgi:hypothetical protein